MKLGPLQQKWVGALRSGEYRQCKEALYDGIGYCCLGVAAVTVLGRKFRRRPPGYYFDQVDQHENLEEDYLRLGLVSPEGASTVERLTLTQLNDEEGLSLSEIADLLESNPNLYFTESL